MRDKIMIEDRTGGRIMGKPTGFMEYVRELPEIRPSLERTKDWDEFCRGLPEEKLKVQGARCMNCGVPYCHSGLMIDGISMGCPINNLIPEWNDLVYRGLWKEGAKRLLQTNSFPEFTGRVCPAPCEGSCTLSLNMEPVSIKSIELAIIEKAFSQGWIVPRIPATRTGKAVAIVGSGPAGLACADRLNQYGHWVTVFEKADRLGGLLMYGIPNMKLDKSKITRRIDLLREEGISFITNTEVGKDLLADKLLTDYDAVVLCGGADKPRDLKIEGRDLKGIHFAVDFLTQNTRSLLNSNLQDGKFISAFDKDVVVIGGGDTGTDCVATSLRHGCRSLVQLEIMAKLPKKRQTHNPWPQWPRVHNLDYGQQEAIGVFGKDPRQYCTMTKRFIGDSQRYVKAIETVTVEWIIDDSGRSFPREIQGSQRIIEAQLVLLAMGFIGPDDMLLKQLAIERDSRTCVKTNNGGYSTNVKGVFAAGDMRRGQSLVVWAIDEGRKAAKECNEYLMGKY